MGTRTFQSILRLAFCCLCGLPVAAMALLNIDGKKNQVYVFGEVSLAYDSNVFAQAHGAGDYSSTASVGMEIKRHAGIIAVDSRASLEYTRYQSITGQNGLNPSFYVEFNKTTGRTTGALTINAYRSNRADSAVNLRTTSWNFPLGLNVKYPINDRFYVTNAVGYLSRRFVNNNALSNYLDYTEAVDLYYVYTSKLDLLGGYRLRSADTVAGRTLDQNFSLGATGGILPKLNGLIRLGYQVRDIYKTHDQYYQWSANAALTWNVTRKLAITAQASRDFSTTATALSVDSLSGTLHATYVFTRRFQSEGGIGGGRNLFLGTTPRRQDEFFSWDVGATFTYNEHFKANLAYTYLKNWSTLSNSNFVRNGYSLNLSSRF